MIQAPGEQRVAGVFSIPAVSFPQTPASLRSVGIAGPGLGSTPGEGNPRLGQGGSPGHLGGLQHPARKAQVFLT